MYRRILSCRRLSITALFISALGVLLFAIANTSPRVTADPLILPYAPPGGWVATKIAIPAPPPGYPNPMKTLYWQRGKAGIQWTLLSSSHQLDDQRSVITAIRSGPAVEQMRVLTEKACAGRGWWFSWRVGGVSPANGIDHTELVFENNSREALIDYTTVNRGSIDDKTRRSMVTYCARFNE